MSEQQLNGNEILLEEDFQDVEIDEEWLESTPQISFSSVYIVPTVLILTGGTSEDGGLAYFDDLKRAGINSNGKIFTRVIDTDSAYRPRFAPGDFYHLTANLSGIYKRMVENSRYFSELRERIGDPNVLLHWLASVGKMGQGAEKPPFATTMFEENLKTKRTKSINWLKAPFKRIARDAARAADNGQDSPLSVAWSMASLHGSTGGGLHLPVAQVLTKEWYEKNILSHRLNLIAFSPNVRKYNGDEDVYQALAVERIRDWDAHVKKKAVLASVMIGGEEIDRSRFPFSQIFLIDNQNDFGGEYSYQSVLEHVALALRLLTTGVIAKEYISNSLQALSSLQRYPDYLCTLNAYEVVIRPQELQQQFALQIVPPLVKKSFLKNIPDQDEAAQLAKETVKAFLNRHKINKEQLQKVFAVQPISLKSVAKLRGATLRKELQNLFNKELPLREEALDQKLAVEVDNFGNQAGALVIDVCNHQGLRQAKLVLNVLMDKLKGFHVNLNKDLLNTENQLEQHKKKMAPSKRKLSRLLISARNKLLAKQADRHYLRIKTEEFRLQLLQSKQTRIVNFPHIALTEVAASLWQQLDDVEAKFNDTQKHFVKEAKSYRDEREHQRPHCEESLLTVKEENKLYRNHQAMALRQLVQGISYGWLAEERTLELQLQVSEDHEPIKLNLKDLSDDDLRQGLVQYCHEPFANLGQDLSIENVLKQRGQDNNAYLQKLKKDSSPLLALDTSGQEHENHEIKEMIYLASEHGERDFWSGVMAEDCLILKNGDPHRISMLSLKLKISPRAVVGYSAWQRDWEKMRQIGLPMQIYSDQDSDLEADDQKGV